MVLEVAVLDVRPGETDAFEAAFREAQAILAAMPGYRSHQLQRCVEHADRYLLLVEWDSLEAHTIGFRGLPTAASTRAPSGRSDLARTGPQPVDRT